MIDLRQVCYRYADNVAAALTDVTLTVDSSELIAIVGPNGSGKSTLLDILAGIKTQSSGTYRVFGRSAQSYTRQDFCRLVAHVPQSAPQGVPFTVLEVALTGRNPYGRGLYDSKEDVDAAERALEQAGVSSLKHRRYSSLSGGEQQRVLLAAAICQQPRILLLDEPGSHLDPCNEVWLWSLMRGQCAQGWAVIVVTHHLALAARCADRIWLLERGRVSADGPPAEALAPARLSGVFRVPFYRRQDEEGRVYLSYGN